jgi:hypothetical protein
MTFWALKWRRLLLTHVLPLGVNLAPRVKFSPRGNFTPTFTPRGEYYLLFRRMEGGGQRISPRGYTFISSGQNSPLGVNFAPGGHSLPLGAKLRISLCDPCRKNHNRIRMRIERGYFSSRIFSLSPLRLLSLLQGCQMEYFQTKNFYLGKFWMVLQSNKFYDHFVYFTAI